MKLRNKNALLPEQPGYQPNTIGIYSLGALGVALAHHLGINNFITSQAGRSSKLFPSQVNLNVVDGSEAKPIEANVSHGLTQAFREKRLPEVILACPNADQVSGLIDEIIELTYAMADSGALNKVGRKLEGLDKLPVVVLVSNGILDQIAREKLSQAISSCVKNIKIGEKLTQAWLGKIVRGLSFVGGEREGSGASAVYKPGKGGAVVLCGGREESRNRVIGIMAGKESIRFIDGKEATEEREWRKSYTNLMTNVVGLILSVDRRKDKIRLDIPVGRILTRFKPSGDTTYIEVEGASRQCKILGEAFFNIAKRKGLFQQFTNWSEFNQKIFLEPIKDTLDFYAHTPSSLQNVLNRGNEGILPDGVPANELAILDPLLIEARRLSLFAEGDALEKAERTISENIAIIKETYRRPQITEAHSGVFRKIFNQTGEITYIAFDPNSLGLTPEQVEPYKAESKDILKANGRVIVPMTAEVFSYGPKQVLGNIAFITNGAGFTLEALDRCTEAGLRLGFISDLRLKFEEGKYYLAMKMALAANPNIDTIAVNVFTTLGTGIDVAKAVQRIAEERPDLKFVVKMEAREQEKGFEILQALKENGTRIIFTESKNDLPSGKIIPLTLDQMVYGLRKMDGVRVDLTYRKYEQIEPEVLITKATFALTQRVKNLLLPIDLSPADISELDFLNSQAMLAPEKVFGREFLPVEGNRKLLGKPIVVIAGYGATARLQAELMRKAGTEVVLLHSQAKNKISSEEQNRLSQLGISVFSTADELSTELTTNYQSGVDLIGLCYEPFSPEIGNDGSYSERIERAVESLIKLKTENNLSILSILIPTEMVPTTATKSILERCTQTGIWLIGPNSPGMSRGSDLHHPFHLKIAQIPIQCISPGKTAVTGVGGTMLFETLKDLKGAGIGTSWAISLGGDSTRGLSGRDAALIAENDPKTKYFVYIGEPGGYSAQELAGAMKAGLITKPVIVKILGSRLPDRCYIGHAGTITTGHDFEKTEIKIEELRKAGAIIVHTSEQMAQVISFLEENSRFGQIDIGSTQFVTAQKVMRNLDAAQLTIIQGLTG